MQPKNSIFKNWYTIIEEELYQKTSADGFSPFEYVILASKEPVDCVDVDQNKTLLDQCKLIKRPQQEACHQEKMWYVSQFARPALNVG